MRRPGPRGPAAAYRVTWCTVAALVCAVGFLAGCVFLGAAAAVCLSGAGAVLAATAAVPGPGPARGRATWAVVAGLCAAVVPVAVIGLCNVLGAPALLLCLLIAAGAVPLRPRPFAPATLRLPGVLRSPGQGPSPLEAVPRDPLPSAEAVPALTTAELCLVWRVTYLRLGRCTWSGEREHLAGLRRACLDELERRDPQAFARWLATARAAGDPGRFFARQQRQA